MTTTYDWIKHFPLALLRQQEEIPLALSGPPFPWGPLAARLGEFFNIQGLTIKPAELIGNKAPEDFRKGFGDDALTLHVTLVPTMPPVAWIMSLNDVQFLISRLLDQPQEKIQELEPAYRNEFYQFIAMETLQALMNVDFDKTLNPSLQSNGDLPAEQALCQDVNMSVAGKNLFGRLIMSHDFLQSWKEHFASRKMEIPKSMMQNVLVTVHIEAGKTQLTSTQWSKIKLGDFILLDFCSLKTEGEGRVMLSVNGMPLFRGKIKDGNIKILEHPLYHEGDTTMSSDNSINEDLPSMDEDAGESLFEESEIHEDEDEEMKDAFESGEFEDENAQATSTEEETAEAPPQAAEEEAVTPTEAAPPQKTSPIQDIPLSVVVEVGRLQMSLQKLTELQPGNVLELNVRPENGVDLVVNGRCVARGELLLLGDALGVRVLDIG